MELISGIEVGSLNRVCGREDALDILVSSEDIVKV